MFLRRERERERDFILNLYLYLHFHFFNTFVPDKHDDRTGEWVQLKGGQ